MKKSILVLSALLLAACGEGKKEEDKTTTPVETQKPAEEVAPAAPEAAPATPEATTPETPNEAQPEAPAEPEADKKE